ncbi:MAG: hypothetical protein JRI25_02330 [Deltaproteobacteria bacterium]|nr:hypothetical protein [Deltaproteobacteria bacterium]MBW2253419.1 hypothetical protein [Deltaproteobacteria bacterium]
MRPASLILALLLSSGCGRPPDAPEELEELCGYLFAHFDDQARRSLRAGTENLAVWLEAHLEETLEGYAVDDLTLEAVAKLDHRERSVDNIEGAAVGYESRHFVDEMVGPLVVDEQEEVFPESYDSHERTFETDPECFLERECDYVRTTNRVEASYALGLRVTTHAVTEYRWVRTQDGWALLHRSWLREPAEVNFDWMQVEAQYYVGASLPREDGAIRLGAAWLDVRLNHSPVPAATALELVINSMIEDGESLDAYLDAL